MGVSGARYSDGRKKAEVGGVRAGTCRKAAKAAKPLKPPRPRQIPQMQC